MGLTTVRLLADDLTGALDTAAELVGLAGPIQTFWRGSITFPPPPNAAFDSATRELGPLDAAVVAGELARLMDHADVAFKKIDSLLRGPTLAELAACMRKGIWRHCVLAPAFPYQGRVTRGGRQYGRDATGGWLDVSGDIVATLRAQGAQAFVGEPGSPLRPGIIVFDAETDEDLRAVAETGMRADGKVLWSGSGGLAQAIAAVASTGGAAAEYAQALPGPILGLFGSDQQATAAQLAACGAHWIRLPHEGEPDPASLEHRLGAAGVVFASFDLPPGFGRDAAAARIRAGIEGLLRGMEPPGTLLAAGGETLRCICEALGAEGLEVQGRIVPGLPVSILRGGAWDGVTVVSKSGAFGPPTLLRDLLDRHLACEIHITERTG